MSPSDPASPRQLNLALGYRESFDRVDFLCGRGNETALALIDRWTDWPARAIALIGPEGSGKSHLAAIWAKAAGGRVIASRAIDASSVPQALSSGALAIEDADRLLLESDATLGQMNDRVDAITRAGRTVLMAEWARVKRGD